jgi:hypothetical protein
VTRGIKLSDTTAAAHEVVSGSITLVEGHGDESSLVMSAVSAAERTTYNTSELRTGEGY